MADKPRLIRKSEQQKKETKLACRKRYAESTHVIRMSEGCWNRWNAIKSEINAKTNGEVTTTLLDLWDHSRASQSTPTHVQVLPGFVNVESSHVTPLKASTVAHSTPVESYSEAGVSTFDPAVSDVSVSGQDEPQSEMSGVEVSLTERYRRQAQATEGSFINISFEVDAGRGSNKRDVSYQPTLSEEEEAYDDDYFSSSSEDGDEFVLDMAASQDESINHLPEIKIGNAILGASDSSDAETLSDTSDSDNDDLPDRNLVGEMKAICFATELLSLASLKVPTCCNRKACDGVVEANVKMIGTSACISWKCNNQHTVRKWSSQPRIKKRRAGDVLLSSALICSGNNFDKVKLMFKFFGLGLTAKTTHYQLQSKHCVPVIKESFGKLMQENRTKYIDQAITVAGDGRMDSPGHSAQYCTYTLIEYESKDIVACEIINKRETDLKSTSMEKEGLKRALQTLKDSGIIVKEICTDASTTVAAFIAREHPDVFHSFDTWHGAKNLGKKLGAAAAEKKNSDLRPWVPDIINHFWYCSRKANGNENAMLARWRGVLHHTVGVHEWCLGDNAAAAACDHEPLNEPDGGKKWLEAGDAAHSSLTKIAMDTRLQRSLGFYVNFRHTGDLESFHDHILMYCSKRFAYTYPVYKARNYLACLDYQHHLNRPALMSKSGEKRFHRMYCKKNNNWTSYEVKEPKKYVYIHDLLSDIIEHFIGMDDPLTSPVVMTPSDPRKFKRTISKTSTPPTGLIMARKRSRFNDPD